MAGHGKPASRSLLGISLDLLMYLYDANAVVQITWHANVDGLHLRKNPRDARHK